MDPDLQLVADAAETERNAIERCRAGDVAGLEDLYTIHSKKVFRTCLRLLGRRAEAEDLTQEVFLHVFDNVQRFEARSAFSTWLYRLTVNRCLNQLRGDRRRSRHFASPPELFEPAVPATAERRAVRRELADRLQALLDDLAEGHRAVLVLREIEDLSYREIAAVLEIPVGTVMSRLHRARLHLRSLWEESEGGNVRQQPGV